MSVEGYISGLPPEPQKALVALCDIIRMAAAETDTAPLTEDLKWGQPSFAPAKRAGTPIRLSWSAKSPDRVALLVHCQTTLVEEWRGMFDTALTFDGTRAVHLPLDAPLPADALHQMAAMALTYHRRKS